MNRSCADKGIDQEQAWRSLGGGLPEVFSGWKGFT